MTPGVNASFHFAPWVPHLPHWMEVGIQEAMYFPGSGDGLASHPNPQMLHSQQGEASWTGGSSSLLTWSSVSGAQALLATLDARIPWFSSLFHLSAQGLLTGNLRLYS